MSVSGRDNKAARATERKRLRNRLVRRSVRTRIAKAKSLIDANKEPAEQQTLVAVSSIDRAVSKGIIHKNKGARLKSRLAAKLNKK